MLSLHAMSKIDIHGARFRDAFICPICGMPKTHYRRYGYRCSVNPEHDATAMQMSDEQLAEARKKWQDAK